MIMVHRFLILFFVLSRTTEETFVAHQLTFENKTKQFCIYFNRPIEFDIEVKLHSIVPSSIICHSSNITVEKISDQFTNEILIVSTNENCSLTKQWTMIKDSNWLKNFYAFIFIDDSQMVKSFEKTSFRIGLIGSDNANNFSTDEKSILLRLNREKIRFDPGVCIIIIVVVLSSMLIGNEWHRQVFVQRIITHYQEQREATKISVFTRFKEPCFVNVILLIGFSIAFICTRYKIEFIEHIHRILFIVGSTFALFYFLQTFLSQRYQRIRLCLMFISSIFVLFAYIHPINFTSYLTMNLILIILTIVIISQMRLANFLQCSIIFGSLSIFECVFLILRLIKIIDNTNDGSLDYYLSGGILHLIQRNFFEQLFDEKLTLVLTFFEFQGRDDECALNKGRIFLSIDDLILPSLLINFCRIFDAGNNHRFPVYYFQVLVSYLFALICAYATMIVTKFDQLFTIFIYPMIFITTFVTALIRGECRKLFSGTLTYWKRPINSTIIQRETSF